MAETNRNLVMVAFECSMGVKIAIEQRHCRLAARGGAHCSEPRERSMGVKIAIEQRHCRLAARGGAHCSEPRDYSVGARVRGAHTVKTSEHAMSM